MVAERTDCIEMQVCRTCGSDEGVFQSKRQCYNCHKDRVKLRYHARFPRMGSDDLYILRCPWFENTWKIGRTSCISRRLLEFNRHVPVPYEVEQVFCGAGSVETKLHRMLSVYRVQGSMSREFFDCPLQTVLDAAEMLIGELRSDSEQMNYWE